MHEDIIIAKNYLEENNLSIVFVKYGLVICSSAEHGIRGLLHAIINFPKDIEYSSAADKIIGKAAALLIAKAKIKQVYTPLASKPAIDFLKQSKIDISYDKVIDYIERRDKLGVCPMENMCMEINDPEEAFRILAEKFIVINQGR